MRFDFRNDRGYSFEKGSLGYVELKDGVIAYYNEDTFHTGTYTQARD